MTDETPIEGGETPDFDSRRLCDDGACTGVIGDDGRCRECGRTAGAGEPVAADAGDEGDAGDARDAREDAPPFDDDRRLCPDGACVGLLGPDGRCKVCGRRD